ncbi:MAG TPA: HAMP domain-containing sensor histidine kinase [Streptosporangiaceae bacterium]|jgi:signal transduction histidine kinase|nr:HAMP domain-containing sensor histidine kinase [Streptosporangiaceae bacterium]
MGAAGRWWYRRSLRARLTLVSAAGLALALAAVALLLHASVQTALVRGLDSTARQGARGVAALAAKNTLPHPIPVAAGTLTVQVLNARGRIVDVSPGGDRLVPLLPPARAAADARHRRAELLDGRPFGIPSLVRVVAVTTRNHQTVIAAVGFGPVSESLAVLRRALVLGTPLLLLLLSGASWLVVGYTLRPIAALRRGAQQVTATGQPAALPVPEARDEVHSLAVTLNDMLTRLGAAQQRQRALVSDTAHELRSPIASIRAQLEVALDHPAGQDWQQTASDVLADTLRLARLAEDLLVLARLDEGSRPRAGRRADLAALARAEVERTAGGRVPVRLVAAEPAVVAGDPDGLRRLLANLIENALCYACGEVTVAVTAADGQARLTVTDDGPGIPPADFERAFARFARLDDARSRGQDEGGAGLGLAIVRATARAHGGDAWLEAAGPGLRAVVRLPLTPETATSGPRGAGR